MSSLRKPGYWILFVLAVSAGAFPNLGLAQTCSISVGSDALEWETQEPGIETAVFRQKGEGKRPSLYAHLVRVQLGPSLMMRSLRPMGRSLRLEQVVDYFEKGKVEVPVAINGDYYSFTEREKDPLGLHISGGQLLWFPARTTSLLLTNDNRAHLDRVSVDMRLKFGDNEVAIQGVNRTAGMDEAVLYSGYYESEIEPQPGCLAVVLERDKLSTMVNQDIVCQATLSQTARKKLKLKPRQFVVVACGKPKETLALLQETDPVSLSTHLSSLSQPVMEAISGGPRILRDGKVVNEVDQEGFSLALRLYIPRQHPRSAVGISADGRTLYFFVAEGRLNRSQGATADDTACILRDIGASDAMLFDGGGSSALYVLGKIVNAPHHHRNHTLRAIANALAIVRRKVTPTNP